MRAEFSVHVDPAELEEQRLAAAFESADDASKGRARRSVKPAPRGSDRTKAGGNTKAAHQPRQYAFRRS
jgi:hypothetical protein